MKTNAPSTLWRIFLRLYTRSLLRGHPDDRCLSSAFRRYFRLAVVLLILGCAKKNLAIRIFYGNLSILEFIGLFCLFPENLRSYRLVDEAESRVHNLNV